MVLPATRGCVPQELIDVITACRQRLPHKRPPAWKVLSMLPNQEPDQQQGPMSGRSPAIEEVLEKVWGTGCKYVACDICRERTEQHWYHCNVCHGGDFDVCPKCVEDGLHCADSSHYLQERYGKVVTRSSGLCDTPEVEPEDGKYRYHSSPKASGEREVVKLG